MVQRRPHRLSSAYGTDVVLSCKQSFDLLVTYAIQALAFSFEMLRTTLRRITPGPMASATASCSASDFFPVGVTMPTNSQRGAASHATYERVPVLLPATVMAPTPSSSQLRCGAPIHGTGRTVVISPPPWPERQRSILPPAYVVLLAPPACSREPRAVFHCTRRLILKLHQGANSSLVLPAVVSSDRRPYCTASRRTFGTINR